jgi:hypothetical protein
LKLAVTAGAGDDFSGVFFFSSHAELAVWALEFHGSFGVRSLMGHCGTSARAEICRTTMEMT